MDRGWAGRAGLSLIGSLFFFNWRGIKQESERQRVGERETDRGDGRRERGRRESGRRGGGGEVEEARNEKLGGTRKQHSEAQVAERAERSRGPGAGVAAVPGSPARPRPLGPPRAQAAGRGAGTPNLGRGAAPLSRDRGARECHGGGQTAGEERGERRRPAAPEPGASARARIISQGLKLSSFPCWLRSLLLWNRSPDSRGGAGTRSPSPRIPRRRLG